MAYYEWQGVMQEAYGLKTHFFYNRDEKGNIKAVCPSYVPKYNFSAKLCSLGSGFNAECQEEANILLSKIKLTCAQKKINSLVISSPKKLFFEGFREKIKKRFFLKIENTEEKNWNSLRDKSRNLIRKAQKHGLKIEKSPKNLTSFYKIYFDFIISKKSIPHTFNFFRILFEQFESSVELITAQKDNLTVGGIMLIHGKKTSAYPFQATTPEAKKSACTQLLIWEAIKSCHHRGQQTLHMGESEINSPVFYSKLNFGGLLENIYQYEQGKIHKREIIRSLYNRMPRLLKLPLASLAKPSGKIF